MEAIGKKLSDQLGYNSEDVSKTWWADFRSCQWNVKLLHCKRQITSVTLMFCSQVTINMLMQTILQTILKFLKTLANSSVLKKGDFIILYFWKNYFQVENLITTHFKCFGLF